MVQVYQSHNKRWHCEKKEAANAGSAVPVPSLQAKNQSYCEEIPGSLTTSQRAHPAN